MSDILLVLHGMHILTSGIRGIILDNFLNSQQGTKNLNSTGQMVNVA